MLGYRDMTLESHPWMFRGAKSSPSSGIAAISLSISIQQVSLRPEAFPQNLGGPTRLLLRRVALVQAAVSTATGLIPEVQGSIQPKNTSLWERPEQMTLPEQRHSNAATGRGEVEFEHIAFSTAAGGAPSYSVEVRRSHAELPFALARRQGGPCRSAGIFKPPRLSVPRLRPPFRYDWLDESKPRLRRAT